MFSRALETNFGKNMESFHTKPILLANPYPIKTVRRSFNELILYIKKNKRGIGNDPNSSDRLGKKMRNQGQRTSKEKIQIEKMENRGIPIGKRNRQMKGPGMIRRIGGHRNK